MTDHVTPIITGLQDQVNKLTGSPGLTAEQLAQVQKDQPGIATEFARASAAADKNSPVFKQKGLDSLSNYTQYWYDHLRDPSGYSAPATGEKTPQQTADDVTKQATDSTTQLVNTYKDLTTSLTNQISQQQRDTTRLITGLQSDFNNKQTDLLSGFQQAQAAQAQQMADLTKQMQQAVLGTGQKAKQPNYSAALDRNKQLNSGGLSATMLTGPTGVAPAAMTLGYTSLLGA